MRGGGVFRVAVFCLSGVKFVGARCLSAAAVNTDGLFASFIADISVVKRGSLKDAVDQDICLE